MAKQPDHVSDTAILRMQMVGGGTLELRGLYACRVSQYINDEHMVSLDRAGFHVVGKFGGILVQSDQTSLPLNDPDKDKKTKVAQAQIVANLAPAADDLAVIKAVLAKKVVEDVTYDQDTGLYVITVGPGEKKKGKRHQVKFTNGTVSPVEPKKKAAKTEAAKPAEPGDGATYSEDDYVNLIGLAEARKNLDNYRNVIMHLVLDVSNADNRATEYGRNIDRWRWAAGIGLSGTELVTHIAESFGGKAGRAQTVGDCVHMLDGTKKRPGILFCHDLADDKLPKWLPVDDRELFHDKEWDLIRIVREVMKVGQPQSL